MENPANLTDFIVAEVFQQMKSDKVRELVEKKIADIISSAVESSFRSYVNVGKQIEAAVSNSLDIHGSVDLPAYGQMVMALLRSKMDETLSDLVNERLSAEINDILQIAPKEIKISTIVQQIINDLDLSDRYGSNITCIIEENTHSQGSYYIYLDTDDEKQKHECSARFFATSGGKIHSLFLDGKDASKTIIMGALWGWEKTLFGTGQRQGDLLDLTWSNYDGEKIRLKQSKTGMRVNIPAGGPLKALLDARKSENGHILLTMDGQPWTADGFRSSWRKACLKVGIDGITFNDLRGTAVTRLALAGCTEAEIATITGHSLRDVRSILDAHYLHRDPKLAESAIKKLENKTNFSN